MAELSLATLKIKLNKINQIRYNQANQILIVAALAYIGEKSRGILSPRGI